MNFKKIISILLCALTLLGCAYPTKNAKNKQTNTITISTEKRNDTKVNEELKVENNTNNIEKTDISGCNDMEENQEEIQKENQIDENIVEQPQYEEEIVKESDENKEENRESQVDEKIEEKEEPQNQVITADEARALLIANVNLVKKFLEEGHTVGIIEDSNNNNWKEIVKHWGIPEEDFICFAAPQDLEWSMVYAVGLSSGNVYELPNQGCVPAYLMQNNNRVQEYNWIE
ncbi:hypothetical protein KQI36_15590 [Clostridium senegalense]|uniref:hypothetical protein n=1 Tax=Clostridium senegalense TaxID=1465809 RepID=UPI001C114966|nr:hypothetical protein [Clostridium senegalense]MBU5228054.1 hypothetical protein [Clostridium senegalense]